MRLIFLGTGGGRFVMANQLRRTGGFLVRTENTLIHVDPGPGAVVALKEKGISPSAIKCVLVSHAHLDHCNDAAVIVEGMSYGGKRKRGLFVGSEYAVNGGEDFLPALSPYHKRMLEKVAVAKPGQETVVGDLRIRFLPTWHDEPTGVGAIFDDGKIRVAYLSDTGYVEGIEEQIDDVYAIIFNLIFASRENVPHTNLFVVEQILSKIKPKVVLLQHFGARMIMRGLIGPVAREIQEKFGIKTIALNDGDVIDLPLRKAGLEEWL